MKLKLTLFVLLCSIVASAQQQQKYSHLKIYCDDNGLRKLAEAGLAVDEGERKHSYWIISDFSQNEVKIIQSQGLKYDILVDDVSQFYKDRNDKTNARNIAAQPKVQSIGCKVPPSYTTPSNFKLGTMGGFFKYNEILANFDSMYSKFPNLISQKAQAGSIMTIEGRPVYWLRISNNPTVEQNKPQILYTAVHHAREPESTSQLIMYMWYLLENYNSNPEIKFLVDNCEMYFIPCLNPDGYIYNETTDPGGGGMWRKNRRNTGLGNYGIDLNRNYSYKWGLDNIGSSANKASETYRGTAGFSEPETQISRDFCNQHHFKIVLNYHTYGNVLIYPWGYAANTYTPDSAQFVEYGKLLTALNHYTFGTSDQTVLYLVNGDSDAWMYGEQSSKPKIMALTPEDGKSDEGFWPPQNRIIPICEENLYPNLESAHLILKYAKATDTQPNYLSLLNGYLNYNLKCLGIDTPATFTVSVTPISPEIISVGSPKTYSNLTMLQAMNDSLSYSLSPATPEGQILKYILNVDNGMYVHSDTIVKRYGQSTIAFASDGNSMTGWTSSSGWGATTSSYYSAPSSITDSPSGNYADSSNTDITTVSKIDLTGAISAQLSFYAKWEIETNYDYAQAEASADNGATWIPLCGNYTKTGNGYQDVGNPLYDGFQLQWVKEEMSLDDYLGQNILIRFRMVSDVGGTYDGFYFDDLKVEKIMNVNTGINNLSNPGISISQNIPNPSGDYAFINYSLPSSGNEAMLTIFNAFGQLIHAEKVVGNQGHLNINTSSFATGVYYYKIQTDKESSAVMRMSVVK